MKNIILVLSSILLLCLAGCGAGQQSGTQPPAESAPPSTIMDGDIAPEDSSKSEQPQETQEGEPDMNEPKKIRFLVDGDEIVAGLYDNPTADALYEMLPLELTFEDFNRTEKIAYLDEELPTEGAPDSCDPAVGDLCFYIPWGNLSVFYQDFRHSESLVPLGAVESGAELLEQLDAAASVTVETVE
ncbi:Uncharacterized conserved protein [uncultured Flavonifractor sp.]|nr:Uncharacterized conserved protein [uncultured Flavonifractor sp.]